MVRKLLAAGVAAVALALTVGGAQASTAPAASTPAVPPAQSTPQPEQARGHHRHHGDHRHGHHHGEHHRHSHHGHHGAFAVFGANGNHVIDKAEMWARMEAKFAKADVNGDGVLTVDEFAWGGKPKRNDPRAEAWASKRVQVFSLIDGDHDGKLTKEEAKAAFETHFARLDANGDGKLTREDVEAFRQRHHAAAPCGHGAHHAWHHDGHRHGDHHGGDRGKGLAPAK